MFGFKKSPETRFEHAKAMIQSGTLEEGTREIALLATEGYAEAEYVLGNMCEFTLKKIAEAAEWYGKASEHGHAQAMFHYAKLLINGNGIKKNVPEAIKWYQAAAEAQIPDAQFALGELYRKGQLTPKDLAKSQYWHALAKKNGYAPAQKKVKQPEMTTSQTERETIKQHSAHPSGLNAGSFNPLVFPLFETIVQTGKHDGFIPPEGLRNIPELESVGIEVVNQTCMAINSRMRSPGLSDEEMAWVFIYVFQWAVYLVYLWDQSTDGAIPIPIRANNPWQNDIGERLPENIRKHVGGLPPRTIYRTMEEWWTENEASLAPQGVITWHVITMSLMATYKTGVSFGLGILGYP